MYREESLGGQRQQCRLLGGYCKSPGLHNEARAKEASVKGVENQHHHPPGLEIYGVRHRKEASVTPLQRFILRNGKEELVVTVLGRL